MFVARHQRVIATLHSTLIGVLITVDFFQRFRLISLHRYLKVSGLTQKFSFHSSGVNCGTILSHQSLLLTFDQIARSLRSMHRHTTAPIMRHINIFLCLSRIRWILFALKRQFLRRICKYKSHATWLQHSIFFLALLLKLRPCCYYKRDLYTKSDLPRTCKRYQKWCLRLDSLR